MMPLLDSLVVTTALPVLRTSLSAAIPDLEWTVNAYNLSFACLLLTGAALGDRFGRRRMLCVGLAAFTAASAAAALSPSIAVLIAARAVQGMGGSLVMPLSLTLVSEAFPGDKRSWAIGVWGGVGGLSGAIGPFVGGVVIQSLGWHWIFWINVPVGLALIPAAALRVRESFGPARRLDVTGLVLSSAGLLGITWGLIRGGALGWGNSEVIGALIAGAAVTGLFLWHERRSSSPMLPLAMFRRPAFASASAVMFFLFAGLAGALFLMSQFFQTGQHQTPALAGAHLLPWSAPGLIVMPAAGRLAGRYGNRPFMIAGPLLQAAGLACVAMVASPHTAYAVLAGPLILAGTGASLAFPTVAGEAVAGAGPDQTGIASGTTSALRQLGAVFGVAVLASVFARPGVYTSPPTFTDGFRQALWAGAAFSAVGSLAALSAGLTARRPPVGADLVQAENEPVGTGREPAPLPPLRGRMAAWRLMSTSTRCVARVTCSRTRPNGPAWTRPSPPARPGRSRTCCGTPGTSTGGQPGTSPSAPIRCSTDRRRKRSCAAARLTLTCWLGSAPATPPWSRR
jgi:EmrB/QacA subfamily drug resistance transporter